MTKGKIDKATAIKSILSDLKKGTDKRSVLEKLRKKWNFSTASFYNWYSEAETQYLEFKAKADPIIEAKEIEALGQIAVSNIMSKLERMQLLSDLASGTKKSWKEAASMGHVVKLESYDPVKYIAELNKMDGSYLSDIKEDEFNGFDIEEI